MDLATQLQKLQVQARSMLQYSINNSMLLLQSSQ